MQIEGPAANDWPGRVRPAAPQPVSARAGGAGRHAYRRAAPRGRGRRVPFRTSASGRGRHLPGGAWGASLLPSRPLPRRLGEVVRPEALSPPAARGTAPPRESAGLRARSRGWDRGGASAWGRTYCPRRLPLPGSGAVWRAGRGLQLRQVCLATLAAGPGDPRSRPWDVSARKARSLESGARGTALKGINQENGLFQTWSYRLLSRTPRWQPWDIGPWPPSLHIQTPNRAERCLLPFCSWHGSS